MTAWAAQSSPFDGVDALCGVWAAELGLFVVGGDGAGIATSPGGIVWTAATLPDAFFCPSIAWAPELPLLVAAVAGGGSAVQILTSPDGVVWTSQVTPWDELGFNHVFGVAWSPTLGLFIATGQSPGALGETVMTSPDGVVWTSQVTPWDGAFAFSSGYAACWADGLGLFVVVGQNDIGSEYLMTSPDGLVWTSQATPFDGGLLVSVCWSSRLNLVVVGGTDPTFSATGAVVMTSPDAVNWTPRVTPLDGGVGYGVADCASSLVLVGDPSYAGGAGTAAIVESPSGAVWTADTSPFDPGVGGPAYGVCYSPDLELAVAVGNDPSSVAAIATAPFSPFVPPILGTRVLVGSPSRLIVTDIAGRTLSVLDRKATQRQFLFTLNGPAYTTGQVASDDPEINIPFPDPDSPAVLTNNRRLLYWLRRETGSDPPYVCRLGSIITNFEDQGADTPTSRYTAYDSWQYMMSRPVRDPDTGELPGPEGLTFPPGSLASDIALNLLGATAAIDGETHIDTSDTGLQEATDPLSDPITFDAGLSVGEAWQQLVATGTIDIYLPPLYDPSGFPGKINKFQTAKRLGSTRFNVVMAWDRAGRSLAGVNRLIDGTRLANQIKYFAGRTGAPLESDAASIAAYGEWWAQQFFPGEANIGLVELMALAEVQIRKNGARNVSLDPAPERTELVLRDYGLGDYLPVWASRNLREPLGIDYDSFDPDFPGASGYHRVFAIPIELDDNGVELTRGIATASEQASA